MSRPSRPDLVALAMSFDGLYAGAGFVPPARFVNRFSADLGRPIEAYCFDYVTDVYVLAGLPLPVMQAGCRTGAAGVEPAWQWALDRGFTRRSWQAEPADLVIQRSPASWHVGIALSYDVHTAMLFEISSNSGPNGGTNRHTFHAPPGVGNASVVGIIDASFLVSFGAGLATPPTIPPPRPAPAGPRLLMLKSPYLSGGDVLSVQIHLNFRGYALVRDGVYGPQTCAAVRSFQLRAGLQADGIVGPLTRAALGITP